MKEYIKIAWRNLWRNRKRTAITSASILFAVFFALLMRSMQLGSYDNMIKNAIETYMGFIQIQNVDYEDDPGIDNTFEYNEEMLKSLDNLQGVKAVVPRVEYGALASYEHQTKGVVVLGVDPEREANLSKPNTRLVKWRFTPKKVTELKKKVDFPEEILAKLDNCINSSYSLESGIELDLGLDDEQSQKYMPIIKEVTAFEGSGLAAGDDGVLVSDRLSKYLKIGVGDTIVLMGVGYHGASAAGLFHVKGIIKLPMPDLDNKLIYMPLKSVQPLFNLSTQATSISLNLDDNSDENMKKMQEKIVSLLNNDKLKVQNWKEFNKVLYQQIESDNQSGKLMLGLLYFIIFFGIFGTVLMMIHERYREFGVLVSIGMQRTKLAVVLIIEMFFMGIMGVVTGTLFSLPILYLGNRFPYQFTGEMAKVMESYGMEPIMPLAWIDEYVFWQGAIVALMVVFSCIYPLRKVMKLKEVEALRA
jgi:putative ABC transport system permease protein